MGSTKTTQDIVNILHKEGKYVRKASSARKLNLIVKAIARARVILWLNDGTDAKMKITKDVFGFVLFVVMCRPFEIYDPFIKTFKSNNSSELAVGLAKELQQTHAAVLYRGPKAGFYALRAISVVSKFYDVTFQPKLECENGSLFVRIYLSIEKNN